MGGVFSTVEHVCMTMVGNWRKLWLNFTCINITFIFQRKFVSKHTDFASKINFGVHASMPPSRLWSSDIWVFRLYIGRLSTIISAHEINLLLCKQQTSFAHQFNLPCTKWSYHFLSSGQGYGIATLHMWYTNDFILITQNMMVTRYGQWIFGIRTT